MNIESRKLRIIELFASLKDVRTISQIESILLPSPQSNRKNMIHDLAGSWTQEEADDVLKTIDEGCENIDQSEW